MYRKFVNCSNQNKYNKSSSDVKKVYAFDMKTQMDQDKSCAPYFGNEVDMLPIAIGYVPWQMWNDNVYNAATGHDKGTIFPDLVKPFFCTPCNQKGGM